MNGFDYPGTDGNGDAAFNGKKMGGSDATDKELGGDQTKSLPVGKGSTGDAGATGWKPADLGHSES